MLPDKLKEVLTSRRFWACITALSVTWFGFGQHQVSYFQALEATIAAIGAYMVSLGIDPGKPADQGGKK